MENAISDLKTFLDRRPRMQSLYGDRYRQTDFGLDTKVHYGESDGPEVDDVIGPEVVEIVDRSGRFDRFRQAISRHRRRRSPICFAGRQTLPSTTKK